MLNSLHVTRETILKRTLLATLLLLFLQCLYNVLRHSKGYPYSTFLPDPNDLFGDHTKAILSFPIRTGLDISQWPQLFKNFYINPIYKGIEGLTTGDMTNLAGTPLRTMLALCWGNLLRIVGPVTELAIAFATYFALIIATACTITRVRCDQLIIGALLLVCYPGLMLIDRGNIDAGFVGLCVILFFVNLLRGKDAPAIAPIAIAINMHPNLIVLLLFIVCLYWPNKWRILRFLVATGIATLFIFGVCLGLAHLMYTDYTFGNFLKGVAGYNKLYGIRDAGLAYGSSLVGGLKSLKITTKAIYYLNYALLLALSGAVFVCYAKRKVSLNECATLCLLYSLLFSHVIADYNLIILLVPILLVYLTGEPLVRHYDRAFFVILLLLLAPKNYFFLHDIVSAQTVINPLLMLGAIGIIFVNIAIRFSATAQIVRRVKASRML